MYTCIFLLEKPFASELETSYPCERNQSLSGLRNPLHILPNAQAWYGFPAKCIQIPLYRTVIFLVRAYAHILDSDLREI